MTLNLKIFSILVAVLIMAVIINLIRKRKLKEELSWIWFAAGLAIIVIAIFEDIMFKVSELLGIVSPQSTVFFLGILFLTVLNLQLSIRISDLMKKVKSLAQELAIKNAEIADLKATKVKTKKK